MLNLYEGKERGQDHERKSPKVALANVARDNSFPDVGISSFGLPSGRQSSG